MTDIRAGDDDRQSTVRQLEQAMVEGRLSIDEMEDRMGQAYRASTWDELDRLTNDLPVPVQPQRDVVAQPVGSWHVALLGDVKRGGWIAPEEQMTGVTLLGNVYIDLSSADIPPEGLTITAVTLLGDIKVIVPDGARVRVTGFHLLGDRQERLAPASASGPTITIKGFNLLGDIDVFSRSLLPKGGLRRWWLSLRSADEEAVE